MKYLSTKFLAAAMLVLGAMSQGQIDPEDSKWGWDDYSQLKCEDGYNKVANYCVKCNDDEGKFFDPVTKKCRTCPTGTELDQDTKSCVCPCQPPRQINPDTNVCECTGSRNFVDNQCKCPEDKPLWNKKKCVACPAGTIYQESEQQCYHCLEGFVADPVTHKCEPEF